MNMIAETDFPYIAVDGNGHGYNAAMPPDTKKYGTTYGGYRNNAETVLYYDFAVQGYDVSMTYNHKRFHLLYEPDHAALCDRNFSTEYETFPDPMTLIKELRLCGRKLIDIIDDLEDVEPE